MRYMTVCKGIFNSEHKVFALRKLLAILSVAVLSMCFGVSITPAQKINANNATLRIKNFMNQIEKRKKQMYATYYYDGAASTLKNAFRENNITSSMDVADSWGKMGIGLSWAGDAAQFYNYHLDVLDKSRKVIQNRGFATKNEMDYIDQGMLDWNKTDLDIEKQFQAYVYHYVQAAKVLDEKAEYLKQYYAALQQLQAKKPYPSNQIDALNNKMSIDTKAFDDRYRKMEADEKQLKADILKSGDKRYLKILNKKPI